MSMSHLRTYLMLTLVSVALTDRAHSPRMVFTHTGSMFKRLSAHGASVRLLSGNQNDVLTAVEQQHLHFCNFQSHKKSPAEKIQWRKCSDGDCDYNVTVVEQKITANHVFVCGSNGRKTLCCNLNISQESPVCDPSEEIRSLTESIMEFVTEEGQHSVLNELEKSTDLYMTFSGSQYYDGIYRFGKKRGMPLSHYEEQYFAGLLLSRRREDPSQDRVYAFYKQKNTDSSLDSKIWTSYVSQVCTADVGGPKKHLQFRWTSQMNARLFCGDVEHRQYFSELVDTATVHADSWTDTRVYALFTNEWGMSAVCVYSIQDIDSVFMNSSIKSSSPENTLKRPRRCVDDSTNISPAILNILDKTSEMKEWVFPVDGSGPILFNHHNYTHIIVDNSQKKRNPQCTVLFLSLKNGRIHKMVKCHHQTSVIIAEYQPFSHSTHILNMVLHQSTRKLYVNSRHELVQLDVANCEHYGNTMKECCLPKDPYCSWNNGRCSSNTHNPRQDVSTVDQDHCPCSQPNTRHCVQESLLQSVGQQQSKENVLDVLLRPQSRYFLRCPVSSHHAQYAWENANGSTACSSKENQCPYLIDSMSPEQVGSYRCTSEESGHRKVLVEYRLALESRALGRRSGSLLCLSLLILVPVNWS